MRKSDINKLKRHGWLFSRYGGIGDVIILTPVFKAVKAKDPEAIVHLSCPEHQVCLFDGNPYVDKVWPVRRHQPNHVDTVEVEKDIWVALDIIKPRYKTAIDYKNSIENNSMYPGLPYGDWVRTQNSNYQNWTDLSLGWAKIDPTTVSDEDKRPIYVVKPEEKKWAEDLTSAPFRIGIQMISSALTRSWYSAEILPYFIQAKYRDSEIFFWAGDHWEVNYRGKIRQIKADLRQSAALISIFDLFIAADSGMSHIAEAIGVKTLSLYTTVPSWTRTKYFKHNLSLDAKIECSPCFSLKGFCPVLKENEDSLLSDRERQVLDLRAKQIPINEAARILNTKPEGLMVEMMAIKKKKEGFTTREAPCLRTISMEQVLEGCEHLLGTQRKKFNLCSIIIPSKYDKILARCLKALKECTTFPYELIVVNSGTEKIDELVNEYEHEGVCSRKLCIKYEGEWSYAKANNLARNEVNGDVICFLNDDVVVGKDWLVAMVARLELTGGGAIGPFDACSASLHNESYYFTPCLKPATHLSGFCLLAEREAVDKVEWFDEHYEHYFDDADLTMRIAQAGYPLSKVDNLKVEHRQSSTTKKADIQIIKEKIDRSQDYFEAKFGTKLYERVANIFEKEHK